MKISVIITTYNRCEELRRTLQKLSQLEPSADEILVCADGCTDETVEMLKHEFPKCILLINESQRGSVFSRDQLIRAATGDIIACFDDDSYPIDGDFFASIAHLFSDYQDAAVFSFPEIHDDGSFADSTKTPSAPAHLVNSYANCAAAMRRDVYLNSQGFPAFFGHMYEEPDYSLQCYSLNYVVRFEPRLTVRHHETSKHRDLIKRHHMNARNELWSVFMRCPFPQLIAVALYRIGRQFQYACSEGIHWAIQEPIWWWNAFRGVRKCMQRRKPIAWRLYYSWMRLSRKATSSQACLRANSKMA